MDGILKSGTNTGLDSEISVGFVAPLNIFSNQPVFSSEAINLRVVVTSMNAQRFELEANMEPSNSSSDFLVHSVSYGYRRIFQLRMPQVFRMNRQNVNNDLLITVRTDNARSSNTVNLNGNALGRIGVGEFINIGNQTKVYLVTSATTDSIQVEPSLRKPIYVGDVIRYGAKCTLTARYDPSVSLGIKYVDGIMSNPGSVKFIEAIQ